MTRDQIDKWLESTRTEKDDEYDKAIKESLSIKDLKLDTDEEGL